MTPHPPVPPGSKYFKTRDTTVYFHSPGDEIVFLSCEGADFFWLNSDSDAEYLLAMRPVIAAVAEVAWLREADKRLDWPVRLMDSVYLELRNNPGVEEALDNARKWREWGEQCPA